MASRILRFLGYGEAAAIDAASLAKALNLSERALRDNITAARLRGEPILSSDRGYFLPAEGEVGIAEIQRFERWMYARSYTTARILRSTRRELKKRVEAELDGQMRMEVDTDG